MTEREALDPMCRIYGQTVTVAETCWIIGDIVPHGRLTTKPEFTEEMPGFCEPPFLRMNMRRGNTLIAGQEPVAFLSRFIPRLSHVQIMEVNPSLAASARGELTGIAVGHCANGQCVHRDHIQRVRMLLDARSDGALSLECEGAGGR